MISPIADNDTIPRSFRYRFAIIRSRYIHKKVLYPRPKERTVVVDGTRLGIRVIYFCKYTPKTNKIFFAMAKEKSIAVDQSCAKVHKHPRGSVRVQFAPWTLQELLIVIFTCFLESKVATGDIGLSANHDNPGHPRSAEPLLRSSDRGCSRQS